MKDNGSEMYRIRKLDGTYVITRPTLFLKKPKKHNCLQFGLNKLIQKNVRINPINIKERNKVV
jgi:hypothetical protein